MRRLLAFLVALAFFSAFSVEADNSRIKVWHAPQGAAPSGVVFREAGFVDSNTNGTATVSLPGTPTSGDHCIVGVQNTSGSTGQVFKTRGGAGTTITPNAATPLGFPSPINSNDLYLYDWVLSSADAATPTVNVTSAGSDSLFYMWCGTGFTTVTYHTGTIAAGSASTLAVPASGFTPVGSSLGTVTFLGYRGNGTPLNITAAGSYIARYNNQGLQNFNAGSIFDSIVTSDGTSRTWGTFPASITDTLGFTVDLS